MADSKILLHALRILFAFLAPLLAPSPLHAQGEVRPTEFHEQPSHSEKIHERVEVDILVPGSHWDLLGQGYQLTADSAVDKEGSVYFTDSRNNRILKIDLDGKISTTALR